MKELRVEDDLIDDVLNLMLLGQISHQKSIFFLSEYAFVTISMSDIS